MKTKTLAAFGLAVGFGLIPVAATPAQAWPAPTLRAYGGGCSNYDNENVRVPVTYVIVNHETGYPLSPLTFIDVSITPSFLPVPVLGSLPNTGTAERAVKVAVPASYAGKVTLRFTPRFTGEDGDHTLAPVTRSVTVVACTTAPPPPPVSTSTTTTVPETTTTTVTPALTPGPTTTTIAVQGATAVAPTPVAVSPQYTG